MSLAEVYLFLDIGFLSNTVITIIAGGIIAGIVYVTRSGAEYASSADDTEIVKKYKLEGISCKGSDPKIWYDMDSEARLRLTYEIDGERITGTLDGSFYMQKEEIEELVSRGETIDICVDPLDHTKFCLMDELYRQKKIHTSEKTVTSVINGTEMIGLIVKLLIGTAVLGWLYYMVHK